MFFAIPINTDAPIYHWPWVTLSLVIANVATFAITGGGDPEASAGWILEYGHGLHPLQWVACNFLHFGIFHLIGNMIFLWGFGLVVEGKIGWWRYMLVYFGIGILRALIEQIIMLGYGGDVEGSGGASGVVYGLLVISLIWAPKNEVSVLVVFWLIIIFRVMTLEISILTFCLYYVGFEFLIMALRGYFMGGIAMGSDMIHLLGAVVGAGVGVLMLKRGLVDCENWDLFAVMKGTYGNRGVLDENLSGYGSYQTPQTLSTNRSRSKSSRRSPPRDIPGEDEPIDFDRLAEKRDVRQTKVVRRIRQLLEAGKPRAALAEYQKLKHLVTNWQLGEPELQALTDGLCRAQSWSDAVPLMEEFIRRFPAHATPMRLKLAAVLIEVQRRPRYALRLLEEIPRETLTDKLQRRRRKMERVAQRLVDDGVIELDGQAWS